MKKSLFFVTLFCCWSFCLNNSFASPDAELITNDIYEETVPSQKNAQKPFEIKAFFEGRKGLLDRLLIEKQDLEKLSNQELSEIYLNIDMFLSGFDDLTKKYSMQPSDVIKITHLLGYCCDCLEKIKEINEERWIEEARKMEGEAVEFLSHGLDF